MKKTTFPRLLAIIVVTIVVASCQPEDDLVVSQPIEELSALADSNDSDLISDSTNENGIMKAKKTSYKEYDTDTQFGRPNSTRYYFKVHDLSGSFSLSVKLYDKATGKTTYHSMTRVGSYWTLSMKISSNGWYDWRYVYSSNKSNISSNVYTLCNTYNTFNSSGISSITWPFGADGSSWNNRKGWISGNEPGGCGSGHNEDGHVYQGIFADDIYAEDWNKSCGTTNDNGATVYSPLDGVVVKIGIDKTSNHNGGYGNYIDIKQVSENNEEYIFRIAHLKYTPSVDVKKYVKAGQTVIGYIGMSGGTSTSYHGHCVLYLNQFVRYKGKMYKFNTK